MPTPSSSPEHQPKEPGDKIKPPRKPPAQDDHNEPQHIVEAGTAKDINTVRGDDKPQSVRHGG
jgi:hypothetical protein